MIVLIPLDGSKNAEGVLPVAVEIAKLPGMSIILVSIVRPDAVRDTRSDNAYVDPPGELMDPDSPFPPGVQGSAIAVVETKTQAEVRLEADARDYLRGIAEKYFPGASIKVAVGDDVATEIIRIAEAEHSDLIVMATHGRSGFARMLTGSVTEKVLRSRVAPLLLTRPDNLKGPDA